MEIDPDSGDVLDAALIAAGFLFLFLLALLLILPSCSPRRQHLNVPVTVRADYSYRLERQEPETFSVWVKDGSGERSAVTELCPASYICSKSEGGRIVFIERRRK